MNGKIRKIIVTGLLIVGVSRMFSQQPDTVPFPYIITLDSFVISEVQTGFSVRDFVTFVQNDTTFYEAFRNLRRINYYSSATVRMFDKEHLSKAIYSNRTFQHAENNCRWMDFLFEVSTGDFFDKHDEMNYYTSKLFSYIFLYRDTMCNKIVETDNNESGGSELQKRKEQLKYLIFKPGQPVDGIPLIKNKMEIFSDEMAGYYDYDISIQRYATGIDCYVFSIKKKPEAKKGEDVIINELTTWFDKKTMEIVARNYSLSNFTSLYDFDVSMQVRLTTINGYRVPESIKYNGYFDITGKKPEVGSVQILIW
ncbi:MAG: hypothetical protein ACHQFW_07245 [Chitinophagales bacterium]